jgi:hypothetical protein
MVYEVIPMLERLEHSMAKVRDAEKLPNVIHIAAEAALIMIGKYYALTDDNEVYRIAIGMNCILASSFLWTHDFHGAMCPDKKVEWFEKNSDWRPEDRVEARRMVRNRWTESYAKSSSSTVVRRSDAEPPTKVSLAAQHLNYKLMDIVQRQRSEWDTVESGDEEGSSEQDPDSIEAYLDSLPIPKSEVKAAGGVLKYWENRRDTRPQLAQMALDFLSAPGSYSELSVSHCLLMDAHSSVLG